MGRIRLLRQPQPLLLGAAPAPGLHAARPAGRLRACRRQGRRTGGPAGHPCRRPDPAGHPAQPDPHRRQELLRRRVRSRADRAGRAAAAPGSQGRTRPGRRAPVPPVAAGHRVDQRHLQRPARPGTPRWAHPGRRDRARAAAHPGLDRRDLAQRPHQPASRKILDRLRPLTPLGINRLGFVPDEVRSALRGYGLREQTRTDHLREVARYLGWRTMDELAWKQLQEFLFARAMEHDAPKLLFRLACEYLAAAPLIRPGLVNLLERVATGREQARTETWARVAHLLGDDRRADLDRLLVVDPLRRLDAHTLDLSGLPAERRRLLAAVGRRLTAQ